MTADAGTDPCRAFLAGYPAELLDQVRELVVQTLTKEARSVKDGMDISLACFDPFCRECFFKDLSTAGFAIGT